LSIFDEKIFLLSLPLRYPEKTAVLKDELSYGGARLTEGDPVLFECKAIAMDYIHFKKCT